MPANVAVKLDRPVSGYGLVDAFPSVRFQQPVSAVAPPGETNRLFVVERKGLITVITNLANPSRAVFLNLSSNLNSGYEECGLLAMAFHPGFATNGYFYTYRTDFAPGGYLADVLSRFHVSSEDPNAVEAASELVLLAQRDLMEFHNGGQLQFGPDGYLYFSIGDIAADKPLQSETPLPVDKGFFGGIFRIDVDNRPESLLPNPHPNITAGAYRVPPDNPWVGATSYLGRPVDPAQVRTEFFAIGFRNPFRFSVDPVTGDIFCGDVGEALQEEIDLVQKGANFGWPYFEGNEVHLEAPPEVQFTPPLHTYGHSLSTNAGSAVIGGLVVRNGSISDLEGSYIFGDFGSGNIWSLRREGGVNVRWIASEPGISSFAQDPASGDLLVLNVSEGFIRRLVYVNPADSSVPQLLSQAGVFSDLQTLAPTPGLESFEINVPFFSDFAIKKRWFGLPEPAQKFGFVEDAPWIFPNGSVWVKHFELEMLKGDPSTARRLETRILIKGADQVFGYTYRWGNSTSEAQLVPAEGMDEAFEISEGGQIRTQIWRYPGRGECRACHRADAGFALGFRTDQLNRETAAHGNQLSWLAEAGYLDRATLNPNSLRRLAAPEDETQPVEYRARSFLAANCSQCHRPDGPFGVRWSAVISSPMTNANIINGTLDFADTPDRVVFPRDPSRSFLVRQLVTFENTPFHHMPPFASSQINRDAVDLLSRWINHLPDSAWKAKQPSTTGLEGSIEQLDNSLVIGGAGLGLPASAFQGYQILSNNFQMVAQIKSVPGSTPSHMAGLLLRPADESDSTFAAVVRDESGKNMMLSMQGGDRAMQRHEALSSGNDFAWLRISRSATNFAAWQSRDGADWELIGQRNLSMAAQVAAGPVVTSGEAWKFATVEFADNGFLSVALRQPDWPAEARLPKPILLNPTISANGCSVERVDFYVDERLVGSAAQSPWSFSWTNALAGDHRLIAVAISDRQLSVTSAPVALHLESLPRAAFFTSSQPVLNSEWIFGASGYAIPSLTTNLPAGAQLSSTNANVFQYPIGNAPIPLIAPGSGPIASIWTADSLLTLEYRPGSAYPFRLTLLLPDYGIYPQPEVEMEISIFSRGGELLDKRIQKLSQNESRYLSWVIRGGVVIQARSLNSRPPAIAALFIDPVAQASAQWTSPLPGAHFNVPNPNILMEAVVASTDAPVQAMEFYEGGTLLARVAQPPYRYLWTNALAGEHLLSVTAIDAFGIAGPPETVTISGDLPAAEAVFLGADLSVQGDWFKISGAGGYLIPNVDAQLPASRLVAFAPETLLWVWDWSEDPRAAAFFPGAQRVASCWFSPGTLQFTLDLLDGKSATVNLYVLDWLGLDYGATVTFSDAANNQILSEVPFQLHNEGHMLSWETRGRVRVTISNSSRQSPMLSGLFIGPPVQPRMIWWVEHFGGSLLQAPDWAGDPDGDGRPNIFEYVAGSDPLAVDPPLFNPARSSGEFLILEGIPSASRDAEITLETSQDLQEWIHISPPGSMLDGKLIYEIPMVAEGPQFFRWRGAVRE